MNNYSLKRIPDLFFKRLHKYSYYVESGWIVRECPYCAYQGCIDARAKYGKKLGHWIWTLQYIKTALLRAYGPKALYSKLYDWFYALDYSQLSDIEVSGIDTSDYPDFCDAYISDATYKGRPITERELEILNEDSSFVYEAVIERIY